MILRPILSLQRFAQIHYSSQLNHQWKLTQPLILQCRYRSPGEFSPLPASHTDIPTINCISLQAFLPLVSNFLNFLSSQFFYHNTICLRNQALISPDKGRSDKKELRIFHIPVIPKRPRHIMPHLWPEWKHEILSLLDIMC